MSKNKNGSYYITFEIKDFELLEKIKSTLDVPQNICVRSRKRGDKVFHTYRLQIGSKMLYEYLLNLGYTGKKTGNISIPYIIESNIKHFIRGYFDGDGSVWWGKNNVQRKTPTLTLMSVFTSCCLPFLKSISEYTMKAGVGTGKIYQSKRGYFRLVFGMHDSLKLYKFMYNGVQSSLFLARKRQKYEEFMKIHNAAVAQR